MWKSYHFGYRMDWGSLCDRSLHWLVRSLTCFNLFEERTGDIVKLLRFVFEEIKYIESLRVVLRDYAAWNMEIFMRDADFKQLLDKSSILGESHFPFNVGIRPGSSDTDDFEISFRGKDFRLNNKP